MTASHHAPFRGFSPDALQFLLDLAQHNERSWFQPRKAEYERLVKGPLEALCVALGERFEARGIPLRSDPQRSPFRIYRDTRFTKDKSPYKTNAAASFPFVDERGASRGSGAAAERRGIGGYVHLSFDGSYVGGGMWHPPVEWLRAFRASVDRDPDRIRAVVADPRFVERFGELSGDRLKRVPQGYPPDHPAADLLKLKDVGFWKEIPESEVLSPSLPDRLADDFERAVPLMRLLADIAR